MRLFKFHSHQTMDKLARNPISKGIFLMCSFKFRLNATSHSPRELILYSNTDIGTYSKLSVEKMAGKPYTSECNLKLALEGY
jgi:hypothetical protein